MKKINNEMNKYKLHENQAVRSYSPVSGFSVRILEFVPTARFYFIVFRDRN